MPPIEEQILIFLGTILTAAPALYSILLFIGTFRYRAFALAEYNLCRGRNMVISLIPEQEKFP